MQVGLSGAVDAFDPVRSRWTSPHFVLLSASELQSTWSGAPVGLACIDELRRVALVHADAAVQASWLWEVMLSVDDRTRARVYRFVIGSSRH